ncbi:DNA-binding Lrp family transcriptional regulator [Kribbella rubisoli]|uniref:DNA-binding Lrp family transcriptional regulator n=1 Tax=Kribbella rubisoli TaxID=3075929 RepID=A0A4Q7XN86_9ACTN|nr:AsnC family transcriptional regulator [Kribbella rubisoli]RZU24543.1 DNA-binding Lrp family transcriptional regulator [Kribbella rubisoli]
MELIDGRIVQCLVQDGRAPFRRIADVLGVSEQTVARRYRALFARGVLRVRVASGAHTAGQQRWFVRVQCRPDAADALADAIAARDDVAWVSTTSGGSEIVCVTFTDREPSAGSVLARLPRTSQVLSFTACAVMHMHTTSDTKWLAFVDPLPEAELALLRGGKPTGLQSSASIGSADAALLAELGRDGRLGVVALAKATGWPQSRVSNRLDELLSSGALHVAIDLAPAEFGFHTTAYLWLTVTPGELDATGNALSQLPETTFTAAVTGAANLLVTVTCRDIEGLYTFVTTKVGVLPAVRQVEVVPVVRRLKQSGTRVHNNRLVLD